MFQKLVIFLYLFSGMGVSPYICGGIRKYNLSTHKCDNSTIVPKQDNLCGHSPFLEKYDTKTHLCLCNKIVYKSTLANGFEKELERKKCCEDETYDPLFDTCCHSTGHKFKIHYGKREKQHVCCRLKAYKRGSAKAVCHKSAHNDKYFKPKKKIRADQKVCKEYTIVYRVDIIGQVGNMLLQYMEANVSEWNWTIKRRKGKLRKKYRKQKIMRIRLDEYSPQKVLTGKSFLIFSNHQYMDKKEFRLRFNEKVYRLPIRRLEKIMKKIRKDCKRLKSRRRSG